MMPVGLFDQSAYVVPCRFLVNMSDTSPEFSIRQCVLVSAGRPSNAPSFSEFNYRKLSNADWLIQGDPLLREWLWMQLCRYH